MELETFRKEIDTIDGELLRLFLQRLTICEQIGIYKKTQGLPVLDKARQEEKLKTLCATAEPQDAQAVCRLFETVMAISRARQKGTL